MQCEENTNEDIINFSKCTSHDILYFLLLLLVVFYIKSWEGRGGVQTIILMENICPYAVICIYNINTNFNFCCRRCFDPRFPACCAAFGRTSSMSSLCVIQPSRKPGWCRLLNIFVESELEED